jgi:hypothetical protein
VIQVTHGLLETELIVLFLAELTIHMVYFASLIFQTYIYDCSGVRPGPYEIHFDTSSKFRLF